MKLSTFLAITGVLAILFGVFFLVAPSTALSQYGVPVEPHNQMQSRYYGGALLQVGILVWLARATQDAIAARAILIGLAVGNALGIALGIWAGTAGLQNAMVWSSVLTFGVLLAGCVYFLMSRQPSASRVA
jgi:hypothetical protein